MAQEGEEAIKFLSNSKPKAINQRRTKPSGPPSNLPIVHPHCSRPRPPLRTSSRLIHNFAPRVLQRSLLGTRKRRETTGTDRRRRSDAATIKEEEEGRKNEDHFHIRRRQWQSLSPLIGSPIQNRRSSQSEKKPNSWPRRTLFFFSTGACSLSMLIVARAGPVKGTFAFGGKSFWTTQ